MKPVPEWARPIAGALKVPPWARPVKIAAARDDVPEPRAAQPQTMWDQNIGMFDNPAEEEARATQAMVDAELFGLSPGEAYRYKADLDRVEYRGNPGAAARAHLGQKVREFQKSPEWSRFPGEVVGAIVGVFSGTAGYIRGAGEAYRAGMEERRAKIFKGFSQKQIDEIIKTEGPGFAWVDEHVFKPTADSAQAVLKTVEEGGEQVAADLLPQYVGTFMENPSWRRAASAGASGVGSLVVAIPTSIIAGPAAGAALLSLAEGGPMYRDAVAAGRTQEEAFNIATAAAAATYLLEKYGLDTIISSTGGVAARFLKGSVAESGTESAQTIVQNAIAKHTYDESIDYLDNIVESAIGGLLGGPAAVLTGTRGDVATAAQVAEDATGADLPTAETAEGADVEEILGATEEDLDSVIERILDRLDREEAAAGGAEEPGPRLETFRSQVGEIVGDKETAAVVTILEARARSVGMTPDEYIEFHELEVEQAEVPTGIDVDPGAFYADLRGDDDAKSDIPERTLRQRSGPVGGPAHGVRDTTHTEAPLASVWSADQPLPGRPGQFLAVGREGEIDAAHRFEVWVHDGAQWILHRASVTSPKALDHDRIVTRDWDPNTGLGAIAKDVVPDGGRTVARETIFPDKLLQRDSSQEGAKGPKASIVFEDHRTVIRAFEAADVSSLAHELAHLFRRDLGGADLAEAEAWAGAQDGVWTVAAEEKFARGFERYLADGWAPTEELRAVFEQFKLWLTEIYRGIKGTSIDVAITPEMRGVFDRLLTVADEDILVRDFLQAKENQRDASDIVAEYDTLRAQLAEGIEEQDQAIQKRKDEIEQIMRSELFQAGEKATVVEQFQAELKERLGLAQLSLFMTNHGDLELSAIEVKKGERKAGTGSQAMTEITKLADELGVRTIVSPGLKDAVRGTTSRSRLVNFYKRFGFVENKGRRKDFTITAGLYREAQGRELFQEGEKPLTSDDLRYLPAPEALDGIEAGALVREGGEGAITGRLKSNAPEWFRNNPEGFTAEEGKVALSKARDGERLGSAQETFVRRAIDITRRAAEATPERIDAGALDVGDTVRIQGETYTVASHDGADVVLKGIETLRIDSFGGDLEIDRGSLWPGGVNPEVSDPATQGPEVSASRRRGRGEPHGAVKTRIRRITGQTDTSDPVSERAALKAGMVKAARAARKAYSEGNKEGAAKEGARLREMIAKHTAKKKTAATVQGLRAKIKRELKGTAVKKQSGKPKGKFTPEIQEILDTLRGVIKLKPDAAEARLMANLEKYTDDLPPVEVVIENRLLEAVARLDTMSDPATLQALLEDIQELKGLGRGASKLDAEIRAKTNKESREKTIEELGGLPAEVRRRRADVKDFTPKTRAEAFWRFFHTTGKKIVGWDDLMDMLSINSGSAPGESHISKKNYLRKAINAEQGGIRRATKILHNAYMDAYGLESNRQIRRQIVNDNTAEAASGQMSFMDENGNPETRTVSFTRAELRKRAMELSDSSLWPSFEKMGYTEETANQIFDLLTPQDLKFIAAQMKFYREYYDATNEVYREMYGVNLPRNEFYSPIAREGVATAETSLGEFAGEVAFRASAATAGGLKSRVGSTKLIAKKSDLAVIQRHISEMEHFKAWAEVIRDLNAVWKDPPVRDAIKIHHGTGMLAVIDSFIERFAYGGVRTANKIEILDTVRIKLTTSVLAGKASITLKQLTSFVAYMDAMPVTTFWANWARFWTNPVAHAKELYEASEMMKNRGQNITRDMQEAMKSDEYSQFTETKSLTNMLLLNVQLGDHGAIYMGGWPLYKHLMENKGMSQAEAIDEFERITANTQQSGDPTEQSYLQSGGSLAKLFTMFMSSPNQYFRKYIGAIRNAKRQSPVQTAKTLAIYHFLVPMLFQLVSDGFTWDEEEQERAAWLGPLNGIFIAGDILDGLLRKALGMQTFNDELPMTSLAHDAMDATKLVNFDELTAEETFRAIRALGAAVGGVTGLPAKTAVDLAKGVKDISEGAYIQGVAEVLGYSPYKAKDAANKIR